jgi:hypothetical protein
VITTLQSPSKALRATAGAAMVMHPVAKADARKQTRSHFVFSFVPLNMAITTVIPSSPKS